MLTEAKIDAEAVGALIVVRGYPGGAFVGAKHTHAREISERLAGQISLFTETKDPEESDEKALERLLKVEEALISGVSDRDKLSEHKLSDGLLRTRIGNATLSTYLFETEGEPRVKILDGEVEEIGLFEFQTVLEAPKGSWWLRWNVYEAIEDYREWSNNPTAYIPREHVEFRDRVPSEVFRLMDQEFSEIEALSQLGLHSIDAPRPWDFARLLSKQEAA